MATKIRWLGLCLSFLVFTMSPAWGQQRMALVIGNSNYEFVDELVNPVNDAVDVSNELQALGFEVFRHQNLNRESFKSAIKEFAGKLHAADLIFVFYAGHGIEIDGMNYLVPTDAMASSAEDVVRQCVAAQSLTRILPHQHSTNVIILDACRSNPFPLFRKESGGLALMDAPPETLISFSTAPGRVANDGNGRNSPFTTGLLNYLFFYDLDIIDMFAKVRSNVIRITNSRQVPWESVSLTRPVILRPRPEVPLTVNILEGDTAVFQGHGVLHARANLQNVSFSWHRDGVKLANSPQFTVAQGGRYVLKASSLSGQTHEIEVIVVVNSSVATSAYIVEGANVFFQGEGTLHGRSNVRGIYKWWRDRQPVGEGASLQVHQSGNYHLTFIAEDGRTYTTSTTKVRIR